MPEKRCKASDFPLKYNNFNQYLIRTALICQNFITGTLIVPVTQEYYLT